MQEGLGIGGVILKSALKTSEGMGNLQSPMFIEQCNFWLSFCSGGENRIIWTLQELSKTFVGRNALVDCVFLSDLFWTFVGAICSAHAFLTKHRGCGLKL